MDLSRSNYPVFFFFQHDTKSNIQHLWPTTSAACLEYGDSAVEFITYTHKGGEIH